MLVFAPQLKCGFFPARLSRIRALLSPVCWRCCVRCQSFPPLLSSPLYSSLRLGVAPAASSNLFLLGLILEDAKALLSWQQPEIGWSYILLVLTQWSLTSHPKIWEVKTKKHQWGFGGVACLKHAVHPRSAPPASAGILERPHFVPFCLTFSECCRFTSVCFFSFLLLLSWTLCSVGCILLRFCIWMYLVFTIQDTFTFPLFIVAHGTF